jgi:hypothetical protein
MGLDVEELVCTADQSGRRRLLAVFQYMLTVGMASGEALSFEAVAGVSSTSGASALMEAVVFGASESLGLKAVVALGYGALEDPLLPICVSACQKACVGIDTTRNCPCAVSCDRTTCSVPEKLELNMCATPTTSRYAVCCACIPPSGSFECNNTLTLMTLLGI